MPGQTIPHESQNELKFIQRAEIDPRVTSIPAQPILVEFIDADGSRACAYPDFAIEIDGRTEIHEVKPDAEYARPASRDRLRRIADACERHGHPYSVALASELHRRRDQAALAEAWRRHRRDVHSVLLRRIDDLLADGPRTVGELLAASPGYAASIQDLHAMLASGNVRADMTQSPDPAMIVHGRASDAWFERAPDRHELLRQLRPPAAARRCG